MALNQPDPRFPQNIRFYRPDEILNYIFSDNAKSITILSAADSLASRLYTSGSYVFTAKAIAGSATGSAVWQIKRETISGSYTTETVWADGNSYFDNALTSYANLSYS